MNCQVCKIETSKYTCPACGMKTCCLRCVKSHKDQFSCSGSLNKTKFIPLSKFSDSNLLSGK